jgi:hypothetical protein
MAQFENRTGILDSRQVEFAPPAMLPGMRERHVENGDKTWQI